MKTTSVLEVAGKSLEVSNLDKVLFPKVGFTKGNVMDYYVRVSPVLLPHLKGRPITLKRYPDGVNGFFFYEKQCPSHRPKWVKTTRVPKTDGGEVNYCVLDGLPALVWAVNLADLELHTFMHRAPAITRPTMVVFDLDPGPPADILSCCDVGLALREMLERAGMKSFPKTSGSKGLQVYAPLNTAVTYDATKAFARAVSEALERQMGDRVVSKMQKSLRKGRVLVDWSQNDDHKTTVCVYSIRARETPTISTPVHWEEVEEAGKKRRQGVLTFDPPAVLKRVEKWGDLFSPVLTLKQRLPSLEPVEKPAR